MILDNVQQQRLSLTFDELDDDDVIHTALIYINVEEKNKDKMFHILKKKKLNMILTIRMFKKYQVT